MSLYQSLKSHFLDDSRISDRVNDRVWPLRRETAGTPAIVIKIGAEDSVKTLKNVTNVSIFDVQVNCVATDEEQNWELALIIQEILNGFSGVMDDTSVINVKHRNTIDASRPPVDDSYNWVHDLALLFTVKVRKNPAIPKTTFIPGMLIGGSSLGI